MMRSARATVIARPLMRWQIVNQLAFGHGKGDDWTSGRAASPHKKGRQCAAARLSIALRSPGLLLEARRSRGLENDPRVRAASTRTARHNWAMTLLVRVANQARAGWRAAHGLGAGALRPIPGMGVLRRPERADS